MIRTWALADQTGFRYVVIRTHIFTYGYTFSFIVPHSYTNIV